MVELRIDQGNEVEKSKKLQISLLMTQIKLLHQIRRMQIVCMEHNSVYDSWLQMKQQKK